MGVTFQKSKILGPTNRIPDLGFWLPFTRSMEPGASPLETQDMLSSPFGFPKPSQKGFIEGAPPHRFLRILPVTRIGLFLLRAPCFLAV